MQARIGGSGTGATPVGRCLCLRADATLPGMVTVLDEGIS